MVPHTLIQMPIDRRAIVRNELCALARTHAHADARAWKGLLKDHCGEHEQEVFALSTAIEMGVLARMNTSSSRGATTLGPLVTDLCHRCGMVDDLAQWAVASLALAFGMVSPEAVDKWEASQQATRENRLRHAADLTRQVDEMKGQLAGEKQTVQTLQRELTVRDQELNTLRASSKQLEARLSASGTLLADRDQRIANLQRAADEERRTLQASAATAEAEKKRATEEAAEARRAAEKAKEDAARAAREAETLREQSGRRPTAAVLLAAAAAFALAIPATYLLASPDDGKNPSGSAGPAHSATPNDSRDLASCKVELAEEKKRHCSDCPAPNPSPTTSCPETKCTPCATVTPKTGRPTSTQPNPTSTQPKPASTLPNGDVL